MVAGAVVRSGGSSPTYCSGFRRSASTSAAAFKRPKAWPQPLAESSTGRRPTRTLRASVRHPADDVLDAPTHGWLGASCLASRRRGRRKDPRAAIECDGRATHGPPRLHHGRAAPASAPREAVLMHTILATVGTDRDGRGGDVRVGAGGRDGDPPPSEGVDRLRTWSDEGRAAAGRGRRCRGRCAPPALGAGRAGPYGTRWWKPDTRSLPRKGPSTQAEKCPRAGVCPCGPDNPASGCDAGIPRSRNALARGAASRDRCSPW
jgi:hypothetical protein